MLSMNLLLIMLLAAGIEPNPGPVSGNDFRDDQDFVGALDLNQVYGVLQFWLDSDDSIVLTNVTNDLALNYLRQTEHDYTEHALNFHRESIFAWLETYKRSKQNIAIAQAIKKDFPYDSTALPEDTFPNELELKLIASKDDRRKLNEQLLTEGLMVAGTPADGHCQFHALADQLRSRLDLSNLTGSDVRRLIVAEMQQQGQRLYENGFIYGEFSGEGINNLEELCIQMGNEFRDPPLWGGHTTLQAAANIWQVEIVLYSSLGPDYRTTIPPSESRDIPLNLRGNAAAARRLILAFIPEFHYDSTTTLLEHPPTTDSYPSNYEDLVNRLRFISIDEYEADEELQEQAREAYKTVLQNIQPEYQFPNNPFEDNVEGILDKLAERNAELRRYAEIALSAEWLGGRPYQREAFLRFLEHLTSDYRSVADCILPTGTGKTRILAAMALIAAKYFDCTVPVITPSKEIAEQNFRSIMDLRALIEENLDRWGIFNLRWVVSSTKKRELERKQAWYIEEVEKFENDEDMDANERRNAIYYTELVAIIDSGNHIYHVRALDRREAERSLATCTQKIDVLVYNMHHMSTRTKKNESESKDAIVRRLLKRATTKTDAPLDALAPAWIPRNFKYDAIIIDESHRVGTKTICNTLKLGGFFQKLQDDRRPEMPPPKVCLFGATPLRLDRNDFFLPREIIFYKPRKYFEDTAYIKKITVKSFSYQNMVVTERNGDQKLLTKHDDADFINWMDGRECFARTLRTRDQATRSSPLMKLFADSSILLEFGTKKVIEELLGHRKKSRKSGVAIPHQALIVVSSIYWAEKVADIITELGMQSMIENADQPELRLTGDALVSRRDKEEGDGDDGDANDPDFDPDEDSSENEREDANTACGESTKTGGASTSKAVAENNKKEQPPESRARHDEDPFVKASKRKIPQLESGEIDIVVCVRMLAEGYDNQLFAVLGMFSPMTDNYITQYTGRIVRLLDVTKYRQVHTRLGERLNEVSVDDPGRISVACKRDNMSTHIEKEDTALNAGLKKDPTWAEAIAITLDDLGVVQLMEVGHRVASMQTIPASEKIMEPISFTRDKLDSWKVYPKKPGKATSAGKTAASAGGSSAELDQNLASVEASESQNWLNQTPQNHKAMPLLENGGVARKEFVDSMAERLKKGHRLNKTYQVTGHLNQSVRSEPFRLGHRTAQVVVTYHKANNGYGFEIKIFFMDPKTNKFYPAWRLNTSSKVWNKLLENTAYLDLPQEWLENMKSIRKKILKAAELSRIPTTAATATPMAPTPASAGPTGGEGSDGQKLHAVESFAPKHWLEEGPRIFGENMLLVPEDKKEFSELMSEQKGLSYDLSPPLRNIIRTGKIHLKHRIAEVSVAYHKRRDGSYGLDITLFFMDPKTNKFYRAWRTTASSKDWDKFLLMIAYLHLPEIYLGMIKSAAAAAAKAAVPPALLPPAPVPPVPVPLTLVDCIPNSTAAAVSTLSSPPTAPPPVAPPPASGLSDGGGDNGQNLHWLEQGRRIGPVPALRDPAHRQEFENLMRQRLANSLRQAYELVGATGQTARSAPFPLGNRTAQVVVTYHKSKGGFGVEIKIEFKDLETGRFYTAWRLNTSNKDWLQFVKNLEPFDLPQKILDKFKAIGEEHQYRRPRARDEAGPSNNPIAKRKKVGGHSLAPEAGQEPTSATQPPVSHLPLVQGSVNPTLPVTTAPPVAPISTSAGNIAPSESGALASLLPGPGGAPRLISVPNPSLAALPSAGAAPEKEDEEIIDYSAEKED